MRATRPFEVLKAKRIAYGLNDAPQQWFEWHGQGIQQCGAARSSVTPTFYLWHEKSKEPHLQGVLGTHVEDDLICFSSLAGRSMFQNGVNGSHMED
eukprot:4915320-Karenia_brevis.AAC.1